MRYDDSVEAFIRYVHERRIVRLSDEEVHILWARQVVCDPEWESSEGRSIYTDILLLEANERGITLNPLPQEVIP